MLEFLANLLGIVSVVVATVVATYNYMDTKSLQWVYVTLTVDGNIHTWVRCPRSQFSRGEIIGLLATLSVDTKSRGDFTFINADALYIAMRQKVKVLPIEITPAQADAFRAKAWDGDLT